MCLVLEKAPPGQEKRTLNLYKIEVHHYEDIETVVDDDTNWYELWKEAVRNDDTEDSFNDWRDDCYSDIISDRCIDYEPDWRCTSSDLYERMRTNWNWYALYYDAQLEVVDEFNISSYDEYKEILDGDWIELEECNSELNMEIKMYFENTTYRYVP